MATLVFAGICCFCHAFAMNGSDYRSGKLILAEKVNDEQRPVLRVTPRELDLGSVKPGETAFGEFHLNNVAPGTLDWRDYPIADNFSFLVVWIISLFTSKFGVVFNIFLLLNYILTAVTAWFVFRHFRLNYYVSACGAPDAASLPRRAGGRVLEAGGPSCVAAAGSLRWGR